MNLKRIYLFVFAIIFSQLIQSKTLVWEENFNGDIIDKSVWTYDVGDWGWGNQELQKYTDNADNAFIENGHLVIQALRDGDTFTSARLKTQGRFSYKYGTIEARVKLPDLKGGLWPAFWQLGKNFGQVGWPACGELDILEAGMASAIANGTVNNEVSAAFHWWHESEDYTGQADYAKSKIIEGNLQSFRIFGMTWSPNEISIWIDSEDNNIITIDSTDPAFDEFRQHHFLILNLAIGGRFTGIMTPSQITANFPAKMFVDYIRVYDNGETELEQSQDKAKSGNIGVYTETSPVSESLKLGVDTELYVWNNMTAQSGIPFEGEEALHFSMNKHQWFGMGFYNHYDLNMNRYSDGLLNVRLKSTSQHIFKVGVKSSAGGESWIKLDPNGENYGFVRDGEWHLVSIPLNKFSVDFFTISQVFMFMGEPSSESIEIGIDDIFWSESAPREKPTGVFSIFSDTLTSDSQFQIGLDGDAYIWEGTLLPTQTTPFEGESSLAYSSVGAGWYGMGIAPHFKYDLSAFNHDNASLNFALKTTSSAPFFIGMKSGNVQEVGQKWISFSNGNDPYGFVRDGLWHQISIPMTDLSDEVNLSEVSQFFELLGIGHEMDHIEIDHIYFAGGADAEQNKVEVGSIVVEQADGEQWHSVTFAKEFNEVPVVILGPPSDSERDPLTVRVRNISLTGFEFQLDEWDYLDGQHAEEHLSYIAANKGRYQWGELDVQVGMKSSTAQQWEEHEFGLPFSEAPIVLAQIVSANDASASTIRLKTITQERFELHIQEEEGNDSVHAPESVGYIALSLGQGNVNGKTILSNRTTNSVTHRWSLLNFEQPMAALNLFAQIQTSNELDSATLRFRYLNDSAAALRIEEERSLDNEMNHKRESVGWVVFGDTSE